MLGQSRQRDETFVDGATVRVRVIEFGDNFVTIEVTHPQDRSVQPNSLADFSSSKGRSYSGSDRFNLFVGPQAAAKSVFDCQEEQCLSLENNVKIIVVKIEAFQVRLRVESPPHVAVSRE